MLNRAAVRSRVAVVGVLVQLVCGILQPAAAQCRYEVTFLEYPINCGFTTVNTHGIGLNNRGAVVGSYQCAIWSHTEAFLWTPEDGFTTLPRPSDVNSAAASDINDEGVICGEMVVTGRGTRGFVYDHGVWTELPPVVPGSGWSSASEVSNAGVVVGTRSMTASNSPTTAFIWTALEGFLDLGGMTTGFSTGAGISEAGHVVGTDGSLGFGQGFLWRDGRLTELGIPPGAISSGAGDANNSGTVMAGVVMDPEQTPEIFGQPALWRDGRWNLLGLLPGFEACGASGMNEFAAVVGLCGTLTPPILQRAMLWQSGTLYDLNDLVPTGTPLIRRAKDINESGQILADGVACTYVLTPVGRPTGDLDIDCSVGVTDFLILLSQWGQANSSADLDGDGTVGAVDLAIMFGNWG